jgi:addiction module HigA family antidote
LGRRHRPAAVRRGSLESERGTTLTPGQHLRAEMQRLNLNQVALGNALGVSRQTINNIVNDRQPISRALSRKLGHLTGQPADYWLQSSFAPAAADSPSPQRLLIDREILAALERRSIEIVPFDKRRLRAASVELTLGSIGGRSRTSDGISSFRLRRGRSATARTQERIRLPLDHLARVGITPQFARVGLIGCQQLHIEPGFSGNLHVRLFNAGDADMVLRSGDPVFALEIVGLGSLPSAGLAQPRAARR